LRGTTNTIYSYSSSTKRKVRNMTKGTNSVVTMLTALVGFLLATQSLAEVVASPATLDGTPHERIVPMKDGFHTFVHAFESTTGLFMGALDATGDHLVDSVEAAKNFIHGYQYSPMQMLPLIFKDHPSSLYVIQDSGEKGNGTMQLLQAASRDLLWEKPLNCLKRSRFATVNIFHETVHVECNQSMLELDGHTGDILRSVLMKQLTDSPLTFDNVHFYQPASAASTPRET
jgi:hypothetical protein